MAESSVNYLNAAGIRVRMRSMERAAFYAAWREKKLRGLFLTAVGNSGNAATRVQEFIQSKGGYAYGGYPMDLRALIGVGPRIAEHTIGSVHLSLFPSWEDMRLKE